MTNLALAVLGTASLATAGWCALQFALDTYRTQPVSTQIATANEQVEIETVSDASPSADLPAQVDYSETILARPLFSPERRPQVAAPLVQPSASSEPPLVVEEVPTRSKEPPSIRLSGIVSEDDARRAFLIDAGGRGFWANVGDQVDGWEIVAIERSSIELKADDNILKLELFQ